MSGPIEPQGGRRGVWFRRTKRKGRSCNATGRAAGIFKPTLEEHMDQKPDAHNFAWVVGFLTAKLGAYHASLEVWHEAREPLDILQSDLKGMGHVHELEKDGRMGWVLHAGADYAPPRAAGVVDDASDDHFGMIKSDDEYFTFDPSEVPGVEAGDRVTFTPQYWAEECTKLPRERVELLPRGCGSWRSGDDGTFSVRGTVPHTFDDGGALVLADGAGKVEFYIYPDDVAKDDLPLNEGDRVEFEPNLVATEVVREQPAAVPAVSA